MADTKLPNRIRELREAAGLSAVKLGQLAGGMAGPTVTRLETGERRLKVDQAHRLAQALGVQPQALTSDGPLPPLPRFAPDSDVQPIQVRQPMEARRLPLSAQAPIMGTVSCGDDGQFEVNLTDGPLEYADLPAKLVGVPDIYGLFVTGESMDGLWAPGDTVWVSRRRPVTPGAFAVVMVEYERGQPPSAFLKQYIRGDNETVTLLQFNPYMEKVIERRLVKDLHRALHWRELM